MFVQFSFWLKCSKWPARNGVCVCRVDFCFGVSRFNCLVLGGSLAKNVA